MSLEVKISIRNSRTFSIRQAALEKYFLKTLPVSCNKTLTLNIDPLFNNIIEAKLYMQDAEDSFSEYNSGVTGLIKDMIYEIPDKNRQYGLRVQILPAGNYPNILRVRRKLSKDKRPYQLLALSSRTKRIIIHYVAKIRTYQPRYFTEVTFQLLNITDSGDESTIPIASKTLKGGKYYQRSRLEVQKFEIVIPQSHTILAKNIISNKTEKCVYLIRGDEAVWQRNDSDFHIKNFKLAKITEETYDGSVVDEFGLATFYLDPDLKMYASRQLDVIELETCRNNLIHLQL
ncbi:hypothetical protein RF11_14075 [Thelohanellus kitauei]|uniref:Uncharacterized protein n=1 Tax=Thelohanellus kitauei TaxID=669202 RepID=A0A0C2IIJ1_THEKT|nr:hypothetical protein RF11_14075 [Thelohanellus kitauei]